MFGVFHGLRRRRAGLGPFPPIDAVCGQSVHVFETFFGSGAGSVANVEVLPVPMLPVANAWQRRRDGARFYHGLGEMTRKIALGAIYLPARGGV